MFVRHLHGLMPFWAPEGGGSTGDPNPGSSTSDDKQTASTVTMTTDELNERIRKAIEERMGRETSTRAKKISEAEARAIAEFREKHGLDDDRLEKLGSLDQSATELAQLRLREQTAAKERERAEAEAKALRERFHRHVATAELERAALKSGALPRAVSQISSLLVSRVSADDDGKVFVLDEKNEPSTTSVDDLVGGYLAEHDYLLSPANAQGGGGGQGGGGKPSGPPKPFDPSAALAAVYEKAHAKE